MIDQARHIIAGIVLALLSYLSPIEGELWSLFIIFVLNFLFGYLSGMIANGEEWDNKKALRCIGEATVFFVLCAAVYAIGRFKGQMEGATQCVSFITYLVLYFYGINILRNMKKMFKQDTAPWQVVSFLYWLLRFKFIERVPWLMEYLNVNKKDKDNGDNLRPAAEGDASCSSPEL